MKTESPDQTNALADMPDAPKKKPEPVVLRSAHDYGLVEQSLTSRAEELKKLAAKNTAEGYTREAKTISADVMAIEYAILPQTRQQTTLALNPDQFEKEVKGAIQTVIFRAFDGLDDTKVKMTAGVIRNRKEALVRELTTRITLFARDVADHSFNTGYQARKTTADVLAGSQIKTLSGRAD